MKIPETSANVGAYYGNEENGQWQPNGVIIDSGVGGGVVGSGDAGIHRPVYPVHHIPRGPHHMPGYVMAGAYYGPAGGGVGAGAAGYTHAHAHAHAPQPEDFSDYMWMENEEEFDKQVMQQLEEEALMEQCIEAMLEDEQRERGEHRAGNNAETSNGTSLSLEETVSRSTLNPLAAEFVPTFVSRRPASEKEDKTEPVAEAAATEAADTHTTENDTQPADRQTEVPEPQPDPPEVSAADIQPERVSRDNKKADKKTDKRPVKQDARKTKPTVAKSETKVQPKKKEAVKAVKSDSKLNDVSTPAVTPLTPLTPVTPATPAPATVESSVSVTKVEPSLPTPTPTPTTDEPPSGPKPINYAAAAKANKPKKPTTAEKTPPPQPQPQPQPEKRPLVKAKDTKLPAKDRPRKNSAK